MKVTEHDINEIERKINSMMDGGRQLSRRMIIKTVCDYIVPIAYVEGHRAGQVQVAKEDIANMKALMEKRR